MAAPDVSRYLSVFAAGPFGLVAKFGVLAVAPAQAVGFPRH